MRHPCTAVHAPTERPRGVLPPTSRALGHRTCHDQPVSGLAAPLPPDPRSAGVPAPVDATRWLSAPRWPVPGRAGARAGPHGVGGGLECRRADQGEGDRLVELDGCFGGRDGVLVRHGDDQIAGHPCRWCGVLTPWVGAGSGRRVGVDWDLADAPVDVEVLSAEEQQQRRESGR